MKNVDDEDSVTQSLKTVSQEKLLKLVSNQT